MTTIKDAPAGFAVLTADGYCVGIWRDREIAEKVVNRSPMSKGERIVEYRPAAPRDEAQEPVALTDDAIAARCSQLKSVRTLPNRCDEDLWPHVERAMLDVARLYAAPRDEAKDAEREGIPYGIIDPEYARVFTMARCLAWAEGYAITFHGSFTRDLDLLAVPWTDAACEPEHLVRRIADAAGLEIHRAEPSKKPHGRLAYTLKFPAFGDPRFVDVSVMPRVAATRDEAKDAERKACIWSDSEGDGNWDTTCGNLFTINDGTPEENDLHYCAFCGGKLQQVTYAENEAENDAARGGQHE